MLIDKYLPGYDFNEFHSININAPATDIYEKMLHCDLSRNFLIRFLFRLRGMPKHLLTIGHLTSMGFIKLDEQPGKEILYGIITSRSTFSNCHSNLSSASFIVNTSGSIIKAVINFKIEEQDNLTQVISTETRILCGSRKMKIKFSLYWFFIKPFSQLVRRSMLRQMKLQISTP
jgi:hypothetical protein